MQDVSICNLICCSRTSQYDAANTYQHTTSQLTGTSLHAELRCSSQRYDHGANRQPQVLAAVSAGAHFSAAVKAERKLEDFMVVAHDRLSRTSASGNRVVLVTFNTMQEKAACLAQSPQSKFRMGHQCMQSGVPPKIVQSQGDTVAALCWKLQHIAHILQCERLLLGDNHSMT